MCGVGTEIDLISEYCVICGKETPYDWFDDVNNRVYYIHGVGQLCRKCGRKNYEN